MMLLTGKIANVPELWKAFRSFHRLRFALCDSLVERSATSQSDGNIGIVVAALTSTVAATYLPRNGKLCVSLK